MVTIGGVQGGLRSLNLFDLAAVQSRFESREITQPPNPVGRRDAVPEDADDETVVYAAEVDPENHEDSSTMLRLSTGEERLTSLLSRAEIRKPGTGPATPATRGRAAAAHMTTYSCKTTCYRHRFMLSFMGVVYKVMSST